jgi:hypothetical protein
MNCKKGGIGDDNIEKWAGKKSENGGDNIESNRGAKTPETRVQGTWKYTGLFKTKYTLS